MPIAKSQLEETMKQFSPFSVNTTKKVSFDKTRIIFYLHTPAVAAKGRINKGQAVTGSGAD